MNVALFVTCLVDQLYPDVGVSAVRLLRRLGCNVSFPRAQTCCGQPAFNVGRVHEARAAAETLVDAFADADAIVSPSGSCVGMIRHYYRELFANDARRLAIVHRLENRTYEFAQFVVRVLGVRDVGAEFPHRVTYHPSCHGARLLGIRDEPIALLANVRSLRLEPLPRADDCCGFGGLFALKLADVSGAMAAEKCDHVATTHAEFVVGTDVGCLMNLEGVLRRRQSPIRTIHLAQILDHVAR